MAGGKNKKPQNSSHGFFYLPVLQDIPLMREIYYSKIRKLKTYYLRNKRVSVDFK